MIKRDVTVIGMGRFGTEVASQLESNGLKVAVIDQNKDVIQRVGDNFSYAIAGDTTDIDTLRDIGIGPDSRVIVAIGELDPSIMTVSVLNELGVTEMYVKAKNEAHKRVLAAMNVHKVYIPEVEVGKKLALQVLLDNDVEVSPLGKSMSLVRVKVESEEMCQKSLKDLDLKKEHNMIIVSIFKGNVAIIPQGDTSLAINDTIIYMTKNENVAKTALLFSPDSQKKAMKKTKKLKTKN